MRQDNADQQRLLLAGRREFGRHVLRLVAHGEVGAMRSLQRAPGGAVAVAPIGQRAAIDLLDFDRRHDMDQLFQRALQCQHRLREGTFGGKTGDHRRQQPHHFGPRRRDGHGGLGHLRLDRLEPPVVAGAFSKQAVAAPHRLFISPVPAGRDAGRSPAPAGRESGAGRPPAPVKSASMAGVSQTTRRISSKSSADRALAPLMRTRRPASPPPGSAPAVPVPIVQATSRPSTSHDGETRPSPSRATSA